MKGFAISFSLAALSIAGPAYAAHHEGFPKPDSNGDGVVTRSEAQAHAAAMFARLDANKDGQIDEADRAMLREQMRSRMFARLDADNNGSISRAEFMASDHPGKHRHAGSEQHADSPGKHHHRDGHGVGHGKMLKMADADGDGRISPAEFTAAADKRFAAIDADNDGRITMQERQAHRQKMRDKWRDRQDN
ncbi:MAG: EF-hand domain-containing protein [Novosphingobium sp.]|nr:EF-hand domain-containing protein [Novosphingobium sp.]